MTSLREHTNNIHDKAQNTEWSNLLISGNISKEQYAHYLHNLLEIHRAIESKNLITKDDILRVNAIQNDIDNIDITVSEDILPSTKEYIEYLRNLLDNKVWSHIYCHYLGYMYGGEIIKKSIPYSATMLEFNNCGDCISHVRNNLKDADPDEAVTAFKYIIKVFNDLWRHYK